MSRNPSAYAPGKPSTHTHGDVPAPERPPLADVPRGPLVLTIENKTTAVSAAEIAAAIAAVQSQVALHWAPLWGAPVPQMYKLVFIDEDPSAPGALGFHDLESDTPTAYILCKTAKDNGVSVSSVLSHEVLEIIGDPTTNRVVMHDTSAQQNGTKFTLYMAEVCDAVEQDSYLLNGVEVSNFVTPAWFDPQNKVGPFDYGRKLTRPLELLPGGSYIGLLYGGSTHGWVTKQARTEPVTVRMGQGKVEGTSKTPTT